jgi:hypothetical protein
MNICPTANEPLSKDGQTRRLKAATTLKARTSAGRARQARRANQAGANLTEFSAALVLLVLGILVPLVDLGIIPVHWLLSKEIVSNYVRKLALSETFGQALEKVNTDPSLQTWLIRLGGVQPEMPTCHLVISRLVPPLQTFIAEKPRTIPKEWLPGGRQSPCSYEIELSVKTQFNPLMLLNWGVGDVPGLNKPFTCVIDAKTPWENFGCDPITKEFFLNE